MEAVWKIQKRCELEDDHVDTDAECCLQEVLPLVSQEKSEDSVWRDATHTMSKDWNSDGSPLDLSHFGSHHEDPDDSTGVKKRKEKKKKR